MISCMVTKLQIIGPRSRALFQNVKSCPPCPLPVAIIPFTLAAPRAKSLHRSGTLWLPQVITHTSLLTMSMASTRMSSPKDFQRSCSCAQLYIVFFLDILSYCHGVPVIMSLLHILFWTCHDHHRHCCMLMLHCNHYSPLPIFVTGVLWGFHLETKYTL